MARKIQVEFEGAFYHICVGVIGAAESQGVRVGFPQFLGQFLGDQFLWFNLGWI